jgi:cobalt-zinc-cadmium efflux system membrane fusion protein
VSAFPRAGAWIALLLALAAGCDREAGRPPVTASRPPSGAVRPTDEAGPPPALEVVPAPRPERGVVEEGPAECATARAKIRLARPTTARRAGIEAVTVTARPLPVSVHANGTVEPDPRRVARLSPRLPGRVREAGKLAGDDVARGESLAVIESTELGEAKAQLRRAAALAELREKTWAIERELAQGKATSRRELIVAEAALTEARIERERARRRLEVLGFEPDTLDRIERGEEAQAAFPVLSPLDGTVMERSAAPGEVVDEGRILFVVADLSRVLVLVDLPERDRPLVEVGARVLFTPDGLPGEVLRGKVVSRGAAIDPETRMVRAITEVRNVSRGRRRLLVPGMFGRVEIVAREAEEALVVPRSAVQWEGCHFVAFVEVREGFYQTRPVELGVEAAGWQEVRSGLEPGDRVVTTGSYLLKTEILKGSIGAGCCD